MPPVSVSAAGPSDGRLAELVFNNPFIGKAVVKCAHALTAGPRVIGLYYAHLDLMAASKGALSIRSNAGQLDTRYRPEDDKRGDTEEGIAALESLSVTADVPYDASVAMGIARVRGTDGCGGLLGGMRQVLHSPLELSSIRRPLLL